MTVIVNGRISGQQLGDDQPMSLGPARLRWETKDANANALLLALPEGGAVDVPVLILADASAEDVDLGMFNGVTEPTLAILDDSHTRYMKVAWNGTYFTFDSGNSAHQFALNKVLNLLSSMVIGNDVDIQFGQSAYLGGNTIGSNSFILSLQSDDTFLICPDSERNTDYGKGTSVDPRLYISSRTAFTSTLAEWISFYHNVTDAIIALGKGKLRTIFEGMNSASVDMVPSSELLSGVSGASVATASLIPAGATLFGIATRITTTLGATGGTTGFQVGDGVDPDRFGVQSAITAGSTTDNTSATADPTGWASAARNVTLTAVGGNFNGTGAVRVTAFYRMIVAPTS